MTYNDITYCSIECANMECKRNQKHIPKDWEIVSMAGFTDCENWKEVDADFMFKELGYEKEETSREIDFIKQESPCEKTIVFLKEFREICCKDPIGEYDYITMAELKAINKKCKELGWE